MEYVGIGLHKKESQICVLSEGGQLRECRIRTEPRRFAAVLGGRPRAGILLEASTESEWVARCLEALGHEVIVADPNFAPMDAARSRKIKTDRRDARALAEACLLGMAPPTLRLPACAREPRSRPRARRARRPVFSSPIIVRRRRVRGAGRPSASALARVEPKCART